MAPIIIINRTVVQQEHSEVLAGFGTIGKQSNIQNTHGRRVSFG
jgi:hypothetical protein